MNDLLTIILKDTYSLSQLKHRLRILKANLIKTFFGGINDDISSTQLASPQDLNWLKSLPSDFYQKFTKDNVYTIFTEFDNEIQKLPTLTIYLTFEPDETTLNQIGLFSRNSFGKTLLLDVKLDRSLIAGAALVYKGVYKDYSLRSKLEERKDEILEGFKRFLR